MKGIKEAITQIPGRAVKGLNSPVVENFLPDFLAIRLVRWLIVRRVLDRISVEFGDFAKPAGRVVRNKNSKTT
ncbi:MAG: hypothetical protein IPK99_05535 [Flavobacteriales bacterium]|nr:hypothetical protein [Flavobacteriales bacterium]